MKKIYILIFIFNLAFSFSDVLASPYNHYIKVDKNNKDDTTGHPEREKNCSTLGQFDGFTAVAFWGDSRIDLVDFPYYGGPSSLDFYLRTSDDWNVQNFGVSGRQSAGINDEIKECLRRETYYLKDSGDILNSYYPNFKIPNNVAFEIGGNDFVYNIPIIYLLPPAILEYAERARDNIEFTIRYLRVKDRNVLVIGNYQAVSWSLKLGNPGVYAWNGFNPRGFYHDERDIDPKEIVAWDEFWPRLVKYTTIGGMGLLLNPLAAGVMAGLYAAADLTGNEPSIGNTGIEKLDDLVSAWNGLGKTKAEQNEQQINALPTGSYEWWKKLNAEAPGTMISFGVLVLEDKIRSMIPNLQKYLESTTEHYDDCYGKSQHHYISTLEYFLHPLAPGEPWVVNPDIMMDVIHPNPIGFAVWGEVVGNKIRELGWNKNFTLGNSTFSNQPEMNYRLALDRIRRKFDYKLSLIEKRLSENVAAISREYVDDVERRKAIVVARIAAFDEKKRLEEERRRQEELARQQREAEEAAAAAKDARRREIAERKIKEEQRIKDEEEKRRNERDNNLLILACVFGGICKK